MTRTTRITPEEFQQLAEGIRIINAGIEHLGASYSKFGFDYLSDRQVTNLMDALNNITNHWAQHTEPPYEHIRYAISVGIPKVLEIEETAE